MATEHRVKACGFDLRGLHSVQLPPSAVPMGKLLFTSYPKSLGWYGWELKHNHLFLPLLQSAQSAASLSLC